MATTRSKQVADKLWSYFNLLRVDGLSYGDYVEQLTYLLFLKMADECAETLRQSILRKVFSGQLVPDSHQ